MKLEPQGTAFLPGGCSLPAGPYAVYAELEVDDDGSAAGEVHFFGEPNYPRPIEIGKEFDLHIPHPDSMLGDNVILRLRFVDDSGAVAGYAHGSRAQFHPGKKATKPKRQEDPPMSSRDVFVIHGRDERLRAGMFEFLRSLGLNPMEWSHAVELTGKGAPYVGEVLDAAFSNAQAVVVLLTPDDLARLRPELCGTTEPGHELSFTPQARPNVLFEAGMSMARNPDQTIMVEIGKLRPFSDVGGRHTLRMDNSAKRRNELAVRLKTAGCPVNLSGTDWQTAGDLRAPESHSEAEVVLTVEGRLSAGARELLVAASEDAGGTVMCVPTLQGLVVSTNRRGFTETNNPRSEAKWRAVVKELVSLGFLESVGEKGEVFVVTDAGYDLAERLREEERKGRSTEPGSLSAQPLGDLISELEDNLEAARAPRMGDVYRRPSNRVWREGRNKFSVPVDIRGRITNAYRQIDGWQDIVLSGLHPNMGSPALDAMVGSLRHELPGLIAELQRLDK